MVELVGGGSVINGASPSSLNTDAPKQLELMMIFVFFSFSFLV